MSTTDWLYSEPWYDQNAYVIGGGSSLKHFDWSLLEKLNTVGCNDAYKLGQNVCKLCIFGDITWWTHHRERLEMYKGIVVTSVDDLAVNRPRWVHYFEREHRGLYKLQTNKLGWNGNTGTSAINLALNLGAKTVYLLGFDMSIIDGETNWHDEVIHPNAVLPSSYSTFRHRWQYVVKDLKSKFPDRRVVNVNSTSKLSGTERISFEEYWKDKGK